MGTIQKSIRIKDNIIKEIKRITLESGKEFSSVANDLLEEAVKTKRCPGIVFSNGAAGRRARIAGTGIEVWEVIATYLSVSEDFKRLAKAYHWITEQQLMAAIGYYKAYPKEINYLITRNEKITDGFIQSKYPFIRV